MLGERVTDMVLKQEFNSNPIDPESPRVTKEISLKDKLPFIVPYNINAIATIPNTTTNVFHATGDTLEIIGEGLNQFSNPSYKLTIGSTDLLASTKKPHPPSK